MSEKIHLTTTIPPTLAGTRLDQALSECFPDYSRARIQRWIKDNQVLVDGQAWPGKSKVSGGENVVIVAELVAAENWQAQAIPLNIVHEDDDIIIINKQAGIVVHPAAGNPDGTLVNALLHHAPSLAHLPRAGIVHRLDKDTTGLMVVAKNLSAHHHLVDALQRREIKRFYQAVVTGQLTAGGTVTAPIGRHPRQRLKMAVVQGGKPATTHYRIVTKFAQHTQIRCQLESGRTHQIRVHMTHINHPLVGDPLYGGRQQLPKGTSERLRQCLQSFKRQALHAEQLQLMHPCRQEWLEFNAPLPADMQDLLLCLAEHDEGLV